MNIAVAVLLLAAVAYVHALPTGPPPGACINIFPVGHDVNNPANTVAAPTDNVNSPYQLDLQGFRNESDPQSLRYYPGGQYTRKPVGRKKIICSRSIHFSVARARRSGLRRMREGTLIW